MPDCLFLMHDDAAALGGDESGGDWGSYIGGLQASGNFQGGGAMGAGVCERKSGAAPAVSGHLTGFICIRADSLDDARRLLVGNPVFEAGGTVEIRELPKTD
jgi:hypothetical protein